MCLFCEMSVERFERLIYLEPKLKKTPDCEELSIEILNGNAYLTKFFREKNEVDISNIYAREISYCPMCGRKLEE